MILSSDLPGGLALKMTGNFHEFSVVSIPWKESTQNLQKFRGFEKGLAGGGWRPTAPKIEPQWSTRIMFSYSYGGIGKRVQKKGPESMLWKGYHCTNPLWPPTPFGNL